MKGRLVIAILAVALVSTATAQTGVEDLERRLESASGAERVQVLNDLAREIQADSPEKSMEYAAKARDLAERISDDRGKARALNNLGIGHYYLADYPRAFEFYNESLGVAEAIGDDERIADALNNIGVLHYVWGDYARTLEYYSRTLEIRRKIGDTKGIAPVYNNLGNVYYATERYEESLDYMSEALPLYTELGEERLVASTLNNIGLIYIKLERYDEALERFETALEIEERIDDRAGLGHSLNHIGMVHAALDRKQESLDYYRRSLAVREEIGDRQGATICRHNIGKTYSDMGDFGRSLEYLNGALEAAQDLQVKEIERDIHLTLSDTFERMNDPERALASYKLYKAVNDSLFDEQTGRRLAELTARHEVDKKDREIEVLRKRQEMQRTIRNVFLAGSVLLLLLVFLLYNRYRLKDRANREMQKANAALQLAQDEREKAARAELAHVSRVTTMGELATALAHELNQPLTAIRGNAQAARRLMAGGHGDPAKIDEALVDIVKGAGRAQEIIQRLREFVRPGENPKERLDINEVLRDIESFARADANRYGVALVLDLAPGLPRTPGDRIQLQQVLLNLVHNSAEAMAETAGQDREIVVKTSAPDANTILVAVKDAGHGQDDDGIDRMFEPFYTTKADGLGMGLAICTTIIESHGGRLWATRNPDRGLTVQFALPCTQDLAGE
jgi:signal transduction histidine kinase/Tfp pilus assembly protein PilF